MKAKEFFIKAIVYDDFNYGETVYVVETEKKQYLSTSVHLSGKCPVCESKRTITINGYTFDCPVCKNTIAQATTNLMLYKWRVTPYIVNSFRIVGDDRKNAYQPSTMYDPGNLPTAREFTAFSKTGSQSNSISLTSLGDDYYKNKNLDEIKNFSGSKVFRDKALAIAICRRLHELQKESLDKFNKEQKTDHVYPFDVDKCVKL
jgi:hypothetical protein